jgi:hypothetical protein
MHEFNGPDFGTSLHCYPQASSRNQIACLPDFVSAFALRISGHDDISIVLIVKAAQTIVMADLAGRRFSPLTGEYRYVTTILFTLREVPCVTFF